MGTADLKSSRSTGRSRLPRRRASLAMKRLIRNPVEIMPTSIFGTVIVVSLSIWPTTSRTRARCTMTVCSTGVRSGSRVAREEPLVPGGHRSKHRLAWPLTGSSHCRDRKSDRLTGLTRHSINVLGRGGADPLSSIRRLWAGASSPSSCAFWDGSLPSPARQYSSHVHLPVTRVPHRVRLDGRAPRRIPPRAAGGATAVTPGPSPRARGPRRRSARPPRARSRGRERPALPACAGVRRPGLRVVLGRVFWDSSSGTCYVF